MKRIACAAVVALALMFVGSGEAKANGWTFNPGYINLSGSIGLSYGGGGWRCLDNGGQACPPGGYAAPAMYNAYPAYGYGQGYYGHGYGYPMGYGYGY